MLPVVLLSLRANGPRRRGSTKMRPIAKRHRGFNIQVPVVPAIRKGTGADVDATTGGEVALRHGHR